MTEPQPSPDSTRIKRTLIKHSLAPLISQESRTDTLGVLALLAFPVIIIAVRVFSDLGWWATIGAAVGGEFFVLALFGMGIDTRERKALEAAWDNFERVFPAGHLNRPVAIETLRDLAQSGGASRSTAATSLLGELGEDVLHNESTEEQLEQGLKPLQQDPNKEFPYSERSEEKRSPQEDLPEIEYTPGLPEAKRRRRARQFDYIPLEPEDGKKSNGSG